MTETVTLERIDGAQSFTWSYGYKTYRTKGGTITVPVDTAVSIVGTALEHVYQVAKPKQTAPKKKTLKNEGNE